MSGRGGTEVEEEVEGTRGHPHPWEVKRTVTDDDAEFVQDEDEDEEAVAEENGGR